MKIIVLTHAEAADPAVFAHVSKLLENAGHTVVTDGAPLPIGEDNPATGLPPAGDVFGGQSLAAQVWGNPASPLEALQQSEAIRAQAIARDFPQAQTGAPSIAGAGQWPTAPEGLPALVGASQPIAPSMPAPLPVNAAPVPSAPANQASPAPGVVTDADGLPWDARIHAGTKGMNKDGRWTAKRGLNDAAFVTNVQAELRQLMALPSEAASAPPLTPPGAIGAPAGFPGPSGFPPAGAPVGNVPPAPAVENPFVSGATLPGSVPPLSPTPQLAPVSGATTASPSETFPAFMLRLSPLVDSGQCSQQMLVGAAQYCGIPALPALGQRPDLIPRFADALRQYGVPV